MLFPRRWRLLNGGDGISNTTVFEKIKNSLIYFFAFSRRFAPTLRQCHPCPKRTDRVGVARTECGALEYTVPLGLGSPATLSVTTISSPTATFSRSAGLDTMMAGFTPVMRPAHSTADTTRTVFAASADPYRLHARHTYVPPSRAVLSLTSSVCSPPVSFR